VGFCLFDPKGRNDPTRGQGDVRPWILTISPMWLIGQHQKAGSPAHEDDLFINNPEVTR
jgi:hypothetical protein